MSSASCESIEGDVRRDMRAERGLNALTPRRHYRYYLLKPVHAGFSRKIGISVLSLPRYARPRALCSAQGLRHVLGDDAACTLHAQKLVWPAASSSTTVSPRPQPSLRTSTPSRTTVVFHACMSHPPSGSHATRAIGLWAARVTQRGRGRRSRRRILSKSWEKVTSPKEL
jgi:hypothetical protein